MSAADKVKENVRETSGGGGVDVKNRKLEAFFRNFYGLAWESQSRHT